MTEQITRTMSSQLTVRLRDRILSGRYAPGAPLLQDTIAAEFGVSKIPVREALVQLQGEGLVDIFAHRGFQVRPLSNREFEEVFNLRLEIEPSAVAEGARMASSADREAARAALDKLDTAVVGDDLTQAGNLNRAFHLLLVVPTQQPVTAEILARLHTLSQRYVQLHLSPSGRGKRASREHDALYAAWSAGKGKQARDLIQTHIASTRDDLAQILRG